MQPVLVILDGAGDRPQPALQKAARIAQAFDAPLDIWVNAYVPALRQAARFEQSLQQAAKTHLKERWQKCIQDTLGDDAVIAEVEFSKDPSAAIRHRIIETDPQLVVVHTSDENTLKRHLMTPRDWKLIRKAPCPVLCVHDTPWADQPKMVAAVDPGSIDEEDLLSARVVSAAKRYALALNGNLQAVHVMEKLDETLILIGGETVPEYARNVDALRDHHRDNFQRFAEGQGIPLEQQVLLEGHVAPTLARFCDIQEVDIMVVGTVQRNLAERLLLGATAETVITQSPRDVLIIKPEGFRTPWLS